MRDFFDNNLSPSYARMLAALKVDAVALRDEFPANIKDVPLLEQLAEREFDVFVSGDTRICTRPDEVEALRRSGLTAIFFGPFWGRLKFWPQAAWLVARWEKIAGFVEGVERGTAAEIKQNGKARVFQL